MLFAAIAFLGLGVAIFPHRGPYPVPDRFWVQVTSPEGVTTTGVSVLPSDAHGVLTLRTVLTIEDGRSLPRSGSVIWILPVPTELHGCEPSCSRPSGSNPEDAVVQDLVWKSDSGSACPCSAIAFATVDVDAWSPVSVNGVHANGIIPPVLGVTSKTVNVELPLGSEYSVVSGPVPDSGPYRTRGVVNWQLPSQSSGSLFSALNSSAESADGVRLLVSGTLLGLGGAALIALFQVAAVGTERDGESRGSETVRPTRAGWVLMGVVLAALGLRLRRGDRKRGRGDCGTSDLSHDPPVDDA